MNDEGFPSSAQKCRIAADALMRALNCQAQCEERGAILQTSQSQSTQIKPPPFRNPTVCFLGNTVISDITDTHSNDRNEFLRNLQRQRKTETPPFADRTDTHSNDRNEFLRNLQRQRQKRLDVAKSQHASPVSPRFSSKFIHFWKPLCEAQFANTHESHDILAREFPCTYSHHRNRASCP